MHRLYALDLRVDEAVKLVEEEINGLICVVGVALESWGAGTIRRA